MYNIYIKIWHEICCLLKQGINETLNLIIETFPIVDSI